MLEDIRKAIIGRYYVDSSMSNTIYEPTNILTINGELCIERILYNFDGIKLGEETHGYVKKKLKSLSECLSNPHPKKFNPNK